MYGTVPVRISLLSCLSSTLFALAGKPKQAAAMLVQPLSHPFHRRSHLLLPLFTTTTTTCSLSHSSLSLSSSAAAATTTRSLPCCRLLLRLVCSSYLSGVRLPLCLYSSSYSSNSAAAAAAVSERHLKCSLPGEAPKRIAVLLSGGVDSSVALRLLHAAGHSCTAFYLKIWFQEDFENFWSACPWEEDLKYAKPVCEQVGVPLEVVHLTDEYWKRVVSHIISEYRCGRTPNPDVLCNTRIKFGAFLEAVGSVNFDYIASGHYACVSHGIGQNGSSVLELSMDKVKDQTYFLSHLSQAQLRRLIFPLGCLSKDDVRRLAAEMDLPNKERKDSQGICFLGKLKFREFMASHIGEMEGILLEAETGDYVGNHQGYWFYTIGQRQGLRLPGGPWYVVGKDVQNNVVFVSRSYYSFDKKRRDFRVSSFQWIGGIRPRDLSQVQCKVRHGPEFYDCSMEIESSVEGSDEIGVVHISHDDQGLAAGQFAAFYQGRTCIGSGIILDLCTDQNSHISAKALEKAKLKDKSLLGKPVKIFVEPQAGPVPFRPKS